MAEHSGSAFPEEVAVRPFRPTILRSVAWNYLGYAFDKAVGFLLVAYVVRRVGVADYGVLLLALSISGFLGLLDLGLFGLLVQVFARERQRNLPHGLIRSLTTASVALVGLGLLGGVLCAGLALSLPGPFRIPQASVPTARAVLLVVALLLPVQFAALTLEKLYEAFHRFDLLNRNQIAVTLLRAAGTVFAVAAGYGVVGLAWVQLAIGVCQLGMLWRALPAVAPGIGLRASAFDWQQLKEFWRGARWALADNISRQFGIYNDVLVLGVLAPVQAVAIYGVGSRIPSQLAVLVGRATSVAFPALSEYHASEQVGEMQKLYVESCRLVAAILLPCVVLLAVFADPIIPWWAGPAYREAVPVMRWLLLMTPALAIFMVSDMVLYARGLIPVSARIAAVESLANLGLSILLVRSYGVVGVAAASAVTHVLGTLFWHTPVACRSIELRPGRLLSEVFSKEALPLLLFTLVLAGSWAIRPTVLRVAVGAVGLLLYLLVWFLRTGLPMLRVRSHAEPAAQFGDSGSTRA